jgi:hypothetical protein
MNNLYIVSIWASYIEYHFQPNFQIMIIANIECIIVTFAGGEEV